MTSSDEEKALLLLAVREDKRRRKMWIHDINKERLQFGDHTLMPQLRKDEKWFYIYFRMNQECFDELLILIADIIGKKVPTTWSD
jgi:hypothetical protein